MSNVLIYDLFWNCFNSVVLTCCEGSHTLFRMEPQARFADTSVRKWLTSIDFFFTEIGEQTRPVKKEAKDSFSFPDTLALLAARAWAWA